ncbi:sugar phosphate permease [Yoonia sediminilitoris]|uniref:Sugar phosphate permease n=2 Tax=Yoonia sediminilitoris TaxID=1286148 RepID=A0A2T6K964_9RHOB|nr:MFS transporter [Yoonia sediminilitoris]PUB11270.1 sugar phosphate permease [Yoonia sediminilitoris]RCW91086.1 sugar phosphate permease [Yoonia sediminilitoris]
MPELQPELPRYRWVIVLASALILALALGSIVNGMSAYVVPLEQLHGWDRAEVSLINVSGIMGLALGGLLTGSVADRFGTRIVVLAGSTVMGISYLAASFADDLWQYYLLMFIAGFFGAAGIFAPIMSLVGKWFPIGAGLAIGIASAGQALGQGFVPFGSAILINAMGVSGALAVTGGLMLIVLLPLASLLRPVALLKTGQGAADVEKDYPPIRLVVPMMCLAILLCCICMSVPLMHLVPHIQGRGYSADQAGGVIFLMLMVGILGRVAFGKLADVIGAIPAYMTATGWMTLLIYGFMLIDDLSTFYLYAPIYGFGYAGVMTGVLATVAAHTPPSRRGFAMGVVTMFGWFGHASGGFLGGYLYDMTGGYAAAYGLAAVAGALNLSVVWVLFWKIQGPHAPTPLAA